jgi:hypothetical protein
MSINTYMVGNPYGPTRTPAPLPTRTPGPSQPTPTPGPPTGGTGSNSGTNTGAGNGSAGSGGGGGGVPPVFPPLVCPKCPIGATSVSVELDFITNSSPKYLVYKDPIDGTITVNGSNTLASPPFNFKWKRPLALLGGEVRGDFLISIDNLPGIWTEPTPFQTSGNGRRNIGHSNLWLEGKNNKRKIFIAKTPTASSGGFSTVYTDRFGAVPASSFGFENEEYYLVFKEGPCVYPFRSFSCLEKKKSSKALIFSKAKFETRINGTVPGGVFQTNGLGSSGGATIKIYKNTSGNFILSGGATSIQFTPTLQYKKVGGWTNLPSANYPLTVKSGGGLTGQSGRTLSLNNGVLNLNQLTTSDTKITFFYDGLVGSSLNGPQTTNDLLLSSYYTVNFEYITKIETRCSFEDPGTIFMGKRTSGSVITKTDDLIDISRTGRYKWQATPTPSPSATQSPTSTPTTTPSRTPTTTPSATPTRTPTPTPTQVVTSNYKTKRGENLIPWKKSADDADIETSPYDRKTIAINQDGTKIVVGGTLLPRTDSNPKGIARVFSYNNTSKKWERMGSDILGNEGGARFGSFVSMDNTGNFIAISSIQSRGKDGNIDAAGKVTVYNYTTGGWVKVGDDIYGNNEPGSLFGSSISLNGNGTRLAIGSMHEDRNLSTGEQDNAGTVRVFSYDSTQKKWNLLGNVIVGDNTYNATFGGSVDLNDAGDVVIVGGCRVLNGMHGAKVFKFANGSWTQLGSSLSALPVGGVESGLPLMYYINNVSINSSGTIVAIADGSAAENLNGIVKIYEYKNNAWGLIGTLTGESQEDIFGYSISLNGKGDRIIIGAPLFGAGEQGKVYVYEYKGGTNWQLMQDSGFVGESGNQLSGTVVAFSENSSVIAFGSFHGGCVSYELKTTAAATLPPLSIATASPTRTPAPTPTSTRTPTPTPTQTFTIPSNVGTNYTVANFKTTLEFFDPSDNRWKALSSVLPGVTPSITCDVYPQRTLLPDADMPLTTAQIDPSNRLISDNALRYICSYPGTTLYNGCRSSVKKIVYIANNFISFNIPAIPFSGIGASAVRTYALPQISYLSGTTGAWNVPTGSPLSIKNVELYPGNIISNAYDFTVNPYYPNYRKVALANPGVVNLSNLTIYQPGSGVNYLSGRYIGSGAAQTGVFYPTTVPSGRVSGAGSQSGVFFRTQSVTGVVSGEQRGIFYTGLNRTLFTGSQTGVFFRQNTSGINLTFNQNLELDYLVEGKRLKMGLSLNLTGIRN